MAGLKIATTQSKQTTTKILSFATGQHILRAVQIVTKSIIQNDVMNVLIAKSVFNLCTVNSANNAQIAHFFLIVVVAATALDA